MGLLVADESRLLAEETREEALETREETLERTEDKREEMLEVGRLALLEETEKGVASIYIRVNRGEVTYHHCREQLGYW